MQSKFLAPDQGFRLADQVDFRLKNCPENPQKPGYYT